MTAADLVYLAARIGEALAWVAAIFAPGLILAALHGWMRSRQKRRAWAATCQAVADEYHRDQPLLDDADRIVPLYGKGE